MAGADLQDLMLAALDGDAVAYRRLLTDLRPRLEGYYRRRLGGAGAEVEDLVQETLIAIHTKRATFDRRQQVGPWVFAIARYKLIDHWRRAGRRVSVPLEDAGEALAVDSGAEAADARRDVERGLAQLSPRARDLVRSVKLEERPVAEVAARTGLSEGAVKVAVHRGFRRMAERLRGAPDRDATP